MRKVDGLFLSAKSKKEVNHNAVRETVTRMLRHFADDGIVSLGRGTVTVADAEKLRRLAGM